MNSTIIAFPPGAGGNHLLNLVSSSVSNNHISTLYNSSETVHQWPGNNFNKDKLTENKITHGHFGEIMSHQELIRSIDLIKFIILSPDTFTDRTVLNKRRNHIGYECSSNTLGNYFDGEQVFLYEPFMYHHYFNVPMTDIMNISIIDFFKENIRDELEKISIFLQIDLDVNHCLTFHKIWRANNNIDYC